MAITLRIDNFDQLPDGGPIEFTVGPRGFDIGRESHLDWTLPDPNRVISGHHCQVRYENGEYWLNDISRNGTFVNGASGRVKSPYRLMNGDRLQIGQYFISVSVGGGADVDAGAQRYVEPAPAPQSFGGDMWSTGSDVAAPQPVDRRWFANEQRKSRAPDVLDQFVDLPGARPSRPQSQSPFGDSFGGMPPQVEMPGALGGMPPGYPQGGYAPPSFAPPPGMGQGAPTGIFNTPAPPPMAPQMAPQGLSAQQFLGAVATAAGISPQALLSRSPDEVAREMGAILRIVTEQLSGLLMARAAAKQMTKSSNRTMIGSENNNPLKFIPDAGEAIEIMFQRNRAGYLSASSSFQAGFEDVKRHEIATYAAMQKALARLMEDLTPERIEDKAGGSAFANKKARSWELYVERWNAKTEHYENGILDVFLAYFADAYDEAAKR